MGKIRSYFIGQEVYRSGQPQRIGTVFDVRPLDHQVQVKFPAPSRGKGASYTRWYSYRYIIPVKGA